MAELLLELFSEEIPARMQARAADDLIIRIGAADRAVNSQLARRAHQKLLRIVDRTGRGVTEQYNLGRLIGDLEELLQRLRIAAIADDSGIADLQAIAAGAAATYATTETDGLASSLDFVEMLLDAANEAGYATPAFRRMARARSYEALGFSAFQKQDMRTARRCYTRALVLDPTIAKNRGVLLRWFEASFGEKASAFRRTAWSDSFNPLAR